MNIEGGQGINQGKNAVNFGADPGILIKRGR